MFIAIFTFSNKGRRYSKDLMERYGTKTIQT